MDQLLRNLTLAHISAEALGAETPQSLCQRLEEGRPAFLGFLKDCGLKLSDRQAFANALGKAQREGKLGFGEPALVVAAEAGTKASVGEATANGAETQDETKAKQAAAADQAESSESAATIRLYAVSDLHWDYEANHAWIDALPRGHHSADAIILAGDLSHEPAKIEQCLRSFKAIFGDVFFCPGNHELWVERPDAHVVGEKKFAHSVAKQQWCLELCSRLGVHTTPAKIGVGAAAVWVVPLLGWYVTNFDGQMPQSQSRGLGLSDLALCKWPSPLTANEMAEELAALNAPALSRAYDAPVITFSHFLPRPDLMPPRSKTGIMSFLHDAVGSPVLEKQLRSIGSKLHVFGHTHINWDCCHDGVHYLQNAIRYPEERGSWKSRVDAVFAGDISRLRVYSTDRPGDFCPLPDRCSTCQRSRAAVGIS